MNPFKQIQGLYSTEKCKQYKKNSKDLSPHIYQISCNAYRNLKQNGKSQAILVSGESGAGKTEAAKSILQSLAIISSDNAEIGQIETKILKSNPILEAFGNARTVCNNNSSRFGKFLQITFSKKGQITGAIIDTYLLEKSRIAWQAKSERNYHIFYQLLCGGSSELLNQFKLSKNIEEYYYLNQSGCISIPGVNDAQYFHEILVAFDNIGIDKKEQDLIFSCVAVILHLGNIEFIPRETPSELGILEIKNVDILSIISDLLGVPCNLLEKNLLVREFRGASRGSVYTIPLELHQAQEARDALAKEIYSRLFDLLVKRINIHLQNTPIPTPNEQQQQSTTNDYCIGVLDIFGFEIFEKNSFEQLLINFANEKLQCQFNQSIFKSEQEEYVSEGISWDSIDFSDNQICVDLIENKPFGILPMIDEECHVPKGSEDKLLDKLSQKHSTSSLFSIHREPKEKTTKKFKISHFAGNVIYTIDNFLEKNKDTLPQDILDLLSSSNCKIILQLFPNLEDTGSPVVSRAGGNSRGSSSSSSRKLTVSQSFSRQLSSLMKTLQSMEQHYIRCIKPNSKSISNDFNNLYSLRQLRCAGLMDTIRIRKVGFSFRRNFNDFIKRFALLPVKNNPNWNQLKNQSEACKILLNDIQSNYPDQFLCWKIGHSKVFLASNEINFLDQLLANTFRSSVLIIERAMYNRIIYKKWKNLLVQLQEIERKRKQEEERKRREEEERKRREEEERKRKLEEEERKRKQEEERKRREEEERKRKLEEEQRKRKEEDERRQKQLEIEQKRKQDEEIKRKQDELQRKQREEQKHQEMAAKKLEQLQNQRKEEEEKLKREEEENKQKAIKKLEEFQLSQNRDLESSNLNDNSSPSPYVQKARAVTNFVKPNMDDGNLFAMDSTVLRNSPQRASSRGRRGSIRGVPPPSRGGGSSLPPGSPYPIPRGGSAQKTSPNRGGLPTFGDSNEIQSRPHGKTELFRGKPTPVPLPKRAPPPRTNGPPPQPQTSGLPQINGPPQQQPPQTNTPSNLPRRITSAPVASPMLTSPSNESASPSNNVIPTHGLQASPEISSGGSGVSPRLKQGIPILNKNLMENANTTPPPRGGSPRGRGRGRGRGGGMGMRGGAHPNPTTPKGGRIQSCKIDSDPIPKNSGLRGTDPGTGTQSDHDVKRAALKSSVSTGNLGFNATKASIDDQLLSVVSFKIPKIQFTGEGKEMHRQQVMHEFLITEKGYLDDMYTLISVFLNPCKQKKVLSQLEIGNIFTNLESLILVNVEFFKQLQVFVDQFIEEKDYPLGKIFLQSVRYFFFFRPIIF